MTARLASAMTLDAEMREDRHLAPRAFRQTGRIRPKRLGVPRRSSVRRGRAEAGKTALRLDLSPEAGPSRVRPSRKRALSTGPDREQPTRVLGQTPPHHR